MTHGRKSISSHCSFGLSIAVMFLIMLSGLDFQVSAHAPDRGSRMERSFYLHENGVMDGEMPANVQDRSISLIPPGPLSTETTYIGNWTYTVAEQEVEISTPLAYNLWFTNTANTPIMQRITISIYLFANQDAVSSGTYVLMPPFQRGQTRRIQGTIGVTETKAYLGDVIKFTLKCDTPRLGVDFVYDSIDHPSGFSLEWTDINQRPQVFLSPDKTTTVTYSPINFTLSGSDSDGSVTRYEIDFNGDGEWDETVNTSEQFVYLYHEFTDDGRYEVRARVWDDEGEWGEDRVNITVLNRNPQIEAWISTDIAFLGETVVFNMTGSDMDGTIHRYRWDFQGDGEWDYQSGSSGNITHTFSEWGNFRVKAQVEDDDQGRTNRTLDLEISKNKPPSADIVSIRPENAYRGQEVEFVGTGYDGDGTITGYEWRSDRDGILSTEATFTTVGLSLGTHEISFRVKDNGSKWSSYKTRHVNVSEWWRPRRITATQYNETEPTLTYSSKFLAAYIEDHQGRKLALTKSGNGYDWTIPAILFPDQYDPLSPSIAVFKSNTYLVFESDNRIYLTYTTDLETWTAPFALTAQQSSCHSPSLTAAGGRLWVSYTQDYAGSSTVYASYSDDGLYFLEPERITIDSSVNTEPEIFSINSTMAVVFSSDRGGDLDLYLSKRTEDGWTMAREIIALEGDETGTDAVADSSGITWLFYQNELNGTSRLYSTYSMRLDRFDQGERLFDHQYGGWNDIDATVILDPDGMLTLMWASDKHGNFDIFKSNKTLNLPPVAHIDSPENGEIFNNTDDIEFSAQGSHDPDGTIESYLWTSSLDGELGEEEEFITTLSKGNHTISLRIKDDEGLAATTSVLIEVRETPNLPPVADAGGDITAATGQEVTFDASDSYDDDGYIEDYYWDFDADNGTDDDEDAEGMTVKHTYSEVGVYTVTLKVVDDMGAEDKDDITVTVVLNTPPVAEAGEDQQVNGGDTVYFDGSDSYDDDGDQLFYEWDFDLTDGIQVDDMGSTVSHIYTEGGIYTVTLTVRDGNGGTDTDTLNVTVNMHPVADAGEDKTAKVGEIVEFDGSESYDPDGDELAFEWDFDHTDGTGDVDADTPEATHVYLDPGNYTVYLRVRDDRGGIGVDSLTVTVKSEKKNSAPVAKARVEKDLVKVGEKVQFFSDGTYDPDDDVDDSGEIDGNEVDNLTYRWRFGDGSTSISKEPVHAYDEGGEYQVKLEVMDRTGANASDTLTVVVNTPPSVSGISDVRHYTGQTINFQPKVEDPEGDDVNVIWDFGDGDQTQGRTVSHTYTRAGNYEITINASDGKHHTVIILDAQILRIPAPVIDTMEKRGTDRWYVAGILDLEFAWNDISVYVRIDEEGDWTKVNSDSSDIPYRIWSVELDLSGVSSGGHVVEGIAATEDMVYNSSIGFKDFKVEGEMEEEEDEQQGGGFMDTLGGYWDSYRLYIMAGAGGLILLIILIGVALSTRGRREEPLSDIEALGSYPEFSNMDDEELRELRNEIPHPSGTLEYTLYVEKLRERSRKEEKGGEEEKPEDIEGEAYKLKMKCPVCKKSFVKWFGAEEVEGEGYVKTECPRCKVPGRLEKEEVLARAEKGKEPKKKKEKKDKERNEGKIMEEKEVEETAKEEDTDPFGTL